MGEVDFLDEMTVVRFHLGDGVTVNVHVVNGELRVCASGLIEAQRRHGDVLAIKPMTEVF